MEVRAGVRRIERRPTGRSASIRTSPWLIRARPSTACDAACSTNAIRSRRVCPMAKPSGWSTSCSPATCRSSTSAPTSASTSAAEYRALVRRAAPAARPARQLRLRPPRIRARQARRCQARRRPGCYPTAAALALKPLVDAGLVERDGIIVDAASGVSGAGRGAAPLLRGRRQFPRLRPAQPSPHRRNADDARRRSAVHAASCPDEPGASSRPATPRRRARAIRSPRCAKLMPASLSSTSAKLRPKPNGRRVRTPPSSPRAMTSGPGWSSRSPRSTISARARRGR